MSEPSFTLAEVVGEVKARVEGNTRTLTDLQIRLAVLERIAITPAKLTLILSVAMTVAATVFGGITAAAVLIH